MRSTFDETVFQHKSVFRKFEVVDRLGAFLEGGLGVFEEILMDL